MPASVGTTQSGGDGSAFRAAEGTHPGLLAEVVDKGFWLTTKAASVQCTSDTKGAKHKAMAVFLLPTQLCSDDAPDDRKGTPMLVFLHIGNLSFNETDDPKFRTHFQKYLASWFGRPVPRERWADFVFGLEHGSGPDQLVRGLTGDAFRAQSKAKPGVPVGQAGLVRVEHNTGEDGKTWANIAGHSPPDPPTDGDQDRLKTYAATLGSWTAGLIPPDAEAKLYGFDDDMNLLKGGESTGYRYEGWEQIKARDDKSASGGTQSGSQQESKYADDEEDSCPF